MGHRFRDLSLRFKLISIFVVIKIIPILILAVVAFRAVTFLGARFSEDTDRVISTTRSAVETTADQAIADSIAALDEKSQRSIERLTREIARNVADFLSDRDQDILFLARTGADPRVMRQLYESRQSEITVPAEMRYDEERDGWVRVSPPPSSEVENAAVLPDNEREWNFNPPIEIPTRTIPIYREITSYDLSGRETFRVGSLGSELRDISRRENTYVRAETYFRDARALGPGEIYVSRVIGAAVGTNLIGPYTRERAEAAGIPFDPQDAGYAGKENPVGRRFQGIVRFVTPVYRGGRKTGYVTVALDHRHIQEFTDYVDPTDDGFYTDISDPEDGNYAFMWDNHIRAIAHPRDHSIVGFDPETGEQVPPWVSADIAAEFQASGMDDLNAFLETVEPFRNQSLEQSPWTAQVARGQVSLDGRYLNFAPQTFGWYNIARTGGSGSFIIFWTNVWKLTTVAAIPYYTGQYGESPIGFGVVTIGANVDEFHAAATASAEQISNTLDEQTAAINEIAARAQTRMQNTIDTNIRQLSVWTALMVALVILVAIWLTRSILARIQDLLDGTARFADNDLDHRIPVVSDDEFGRVAGAFNLMADNLQESIDTIRRQNEDLVRADRVKDEFLANTSHELRTPLNGIIGISQSLLDGIAGPVNRQMQFNLSTIITSGKRLTNLINDILDFSKLRNHDIQLNRRPVDLRALAEVIIVISRPMIDRSRKDVELVNVVPEEFPAVLADEDRLQQILINLVGNAIKFTAEGSITIGANIKGENARVWVADTGIGIPEEAQGRIFESFEQADGSISREYGGTGIGLNVTRQLVELHDGSIWVESQDGVGSTFFFTLPVSDRPAEHSDRSLELHGLARIQEEVPTPASDGSDDDLSATGASEVTEASDATDIAPLEPVQESGNTPPVDILIVDDEPVNLQVLENNLRLGRYRVRQATNGEEAIEAVAERKPDLVILDVMMPRMSGYEVSAQLRRRYSPTQLPIILVTAKNQVSDLIEGFSVGANDYLTKPIIKEELMARIRLHLELSQINMAYSRFVPHEFFDLLGRESVLDVQLGDNREQDLTILFLDIRGFTTLSEQMNPEETFKFLNSFLSNLEPFIRDQDGIIDKYIGDAIMALFADSADRAVDACVAMFRGLAEYNAGRHNAGYDAVEIGIGLNSGETRLGIIGGPGRVQSTVIGDAVNLASRVEQLTKEYSTPLLISESTHGLLSENRYTTRLIDYVIPKGKTQRVAIYEVLDGVYTPEVEARKHRILEDFARGVRLYHEGAYPEAEQAFQACLEVDPEDTPSLIYVERSRNDMISSLYQ